MLDCAATLTRLTHETRKFSEPGGNSAWNLRQSSMLALAFYVALGLVLVAAIAGGVVLFWIARQDGAPQGRWLGILIIVFAVLAGVYLIFGSPLRHLRIL